MRDGPGRGTPARTVQRRSVDDIARASGAQQINGMRRSQQLYTPAAQRRVVRRATPATLTGVSGRPTTAWAVETKLWTPGIASRPPNSNPISAIAPKKAAMLNRFDIVISDLLA
jgi:hypothetical protein